MTHNEQTEVISSNALSDQTIDVSAGVNRKQGVSVIERYQDKHGLQLCEVSDIVACLRQQSHNFPCISSSDGVQLALSFPTGVGTREGGCFRVEALNMSDLILSQRTRRPLSRALLCNTYRHFEPSCATGFRNWAINKCFVRREPGTRTLRQPLDEAARDLPFGLVCLHSSYRVWISGDFAASFWFSVLLVAFEISPGICLSLFRRVMLIPICRIKVTTESANEFSSLALSLYQRASFYIETRLRRLIDVTVRSCLFP